MKRKRLPARFSRSPSNDNDGERVMRCRDCGNDRVVPGYLAHPRHFVCRFCLGLRGFVLPLNVEPLWRAAHTRRGRAR